MQENKFTLVAAIAAPTAAAAPLQPPPPQPPAPPPPPPQRPPLIASLCCWPLFPISIGKRNHENNGGMSTEFFLIYTPLVSRACALAEISQQVQRLKQSTLPTHRHRNREAPNSSYSLQKGALLGIDSSVPAAALVQGLLNTEHQELAGRFFGPKAFPVP